MIVTQIQCTIFISRIHARELRDSSISRSALTSGFFLRYEKSPGFGFENVRVLGLGAGGRGFVCSLEANFDGVFENFRSLLDVKNRGVLLQGAFGSSGGSH